MSALALMPVCLGTLLTVGLMGVLGIDFNLMTVVVLPLIIGTGIDDGVHLVCRLQGSQGDVVQALSGIASPLVATTMTSMLAFGSMLTAKNPGFRELGLVTMSGLGLCLVITLVAVPCLLARQRNNKL